PFPGFNRPFRMGLVMTRAANGVEVQGLVNGTVFFRRHLKGLQEHAAKPALGCRNLHCEFGDLTARGRPATKGLKPAPAPAPAVVSVAMVLRLPLGRVGWLAGLLGLGLAGVLALGAGRLWSQSAALRAAVPLDIDEAVVRLEAGRLKGPVLLRGVLTAADPL